MFDYSGLLEGATGPIAYNGLSDEVARRLSERILFGELNEGQRITERDVAEEMGLSRGPVRDALRQLERDGLIELLPRRGARVAALTRDDVEEYVALRMALEPLAVQAFLEYEDPAKFDVLERSLETIEAAADADDWRALTLAHMEFHRLIYTMPGRKRLTKVWELLRGPMVQTFRRHPDIASTKTAAEMHRELFDTLRTGEAETAKCLAQEQVISSQDSLMRLVPAPRARRGSR